MTAGRLHSVETLGTLDGPGVRTVLFFAGCPLDCIYCHNPDARDPAAGEEIDAAQVVARVRRYKPYYGSTGGVTLSGGEPLLQAAFARDVAQWLAAEGVHVALDTSGGVWNETVRALVDAVPLVILDVKHTDAATYRHITGRDNAAFLAFFRYCVQLQKRLWVRQVIVPGLNDTVRNVHALKQFVAGANVERMELLPYHTMGVDKWRKLGRPYPLEGTPPADEALMQPLFRALDEA